ncbi:hypothetical protein DTL21_25785 [Bremerella cremea]|uniref:Uncharacterized protein n=1 Tax=Blastopirellula marina TaxID=124 RepID=A0A2S8FBH0_9BACT|nr:MULTISPECIES: hypothetical protein [Pirellulaceae]PQO29470.1 hypothetical protein C5Y83_25740 [Blastopirellula marina]RCS42774.1 hypothetical protein DTL21_25785 [Bremerella cremea]
MPDADTLVWGLKAFVFALTILGIAKLFCMLGLSSRMSDRGDELWSWITLITALCGVADNWAGKYVAGLGIALSAVSWVGTLVVLVVGWRNHRKYESTKRMIFLSCLVAAELILYGVFALCVVLFFQLLNPEAPSAPPQP